MTQWPNNEVIHVLCVSVAKSSGIEIENCQANGSNNLRITGLYWAGLGQGSKGKVLPFWD